MSQDNKGNPLQKLVQVLKRPSRPHYAVTEASEWLAIMDKFGVRLPTDFQDFIGIYGTGTVGDFVLIFNPFSPDKYSNLFFNMEFILSSAYQAKEFPLPLYPQSGGLLPFAKTDDGDYLWWKTEGEADNWTIVVTEVRSDNYEVYPMTMTDFLVKLIIPDPDPQKDILQTSEILSSFDRYAPYESLWVLLEKTLRNFKLTLIREVTQANIEVSRSKLDTLLSYHGLELETELVQQQLETWQREGFIELLKSDEVYLRVVGEMQSSPD